MSESIDSLKAKCGAHEMMILNLWINLLCELKDSKSAIDLMNSKAQKALTRPGASRLAAETAEEFDRLCRVISEKLDEKDF